MFKLQNMSQESKNKWGECLKIDFMSSEDSGEEGKQSPSFVTRPLPWRSGQVNDLFAKLDKKFNETSSVRGRTMTLQRTIGDPSDRMPPIGVPEWMVKDKK